MAVHLNRKTLVIYEKSYRADKVRRRTYCRIRLLDGSGQVYEAEELESLWLPRWKIFFLCVAFVVIVTAGFVQLTNWFEYLIFNLL